MSPTNLIASVLARLRNVAIERREDYDLVLQRYALERFLYRLSQSDVAKQFVLKGALLHTLWTSARYRPTRDLDLLGYGESNQEWVRSAISSICRTRVIEDGIRYDLESLRIEDIREGQAYAGLRAMMRCHLGRTRISIQIDIGFGDIVVPAVRRETFPSLLDMPAPEIRTYTKESVIAEKLHAIVMLGMANSRIKDYYDLWALANSSAFDGRILSRAIGETFRRRRTPVPDSLPAGLSDAFAEREEFALLWTRFLSRAELSESTPALSTIVKNLRHFLTEPTRAAREGVLLDKTWNPQGSWEL